MREIKFRGWNKKSHMMVDNIQLFSPKDTYSLNEAFDPEMIVLPLQYTGMKDKNKTEIYEGDIVKHFFNGELLANEVSFKRGTYMLGNYHLGYALDGEMAGKATIIGNVYQNKDLL